MSPAFEAALARLYVDRDALEEFLADPRAFLAGSGLSADEIEALAGIDRSGLRLAAHSFARKRAGAPPKRSWVARLLGL